MQWEEERSRERMRERRKEKEVKCKRDGDTEIWERVLWGEGERESLRDESRFLCAFSPYPPSALPQAGAARYLPSHHKSTSHSLSLFPFLSSHFPISRFPLSLLSLLLSFSLPLPSPLLPNFSSLISFRGDVWSRKERESSHRSLPSYPPYPPP